MITLIKSFPANRRDLKAQVFYPEPWKGGAWHLYAQQVASGRGPVTGSVQIV